MGRRVVRHDGAKTRLLRAAAAAAAAAGVPMSENRCNGYAARVWRRACRTLAADAHRHPQRPRERATHLRGAGGRARDEGVLERLDAHHLRGGRELAVRHARSLVLLILRAVGRADARLAPPLRRAQSARVRGRAGATAADVVGKRPRSGNARRDRG
eukprot:114132-Prymnesium_polylepis.2